MNRLKEKYVNEIVPSLKEEFNYANVKRLNFGIIGISYLCYN